MIVARTSRRCGAVALETAIVMPVMMFLLIMLVQGGIAVFRAHQVTAQAREAARYASVRGAAWSREVKKASPSSADIYEAAILPLAASMDLKGLTYKIEWIEEGSETVFQWDDASKKPSATSPTGELIQNRVRVTVTYRGSEIFLLGAFRFSSTTELPMAF